MSEQEPLLTVAGGSYPGSGRSSFASDMEGGHNCDRVHPSGGFRSPSLRMRVKYAFNRFIESYRLSGKLMLLSISTGLLVVLGAVLIRAASEIDKSPMDFRESTWLAWGVMADPGTHVAETSPWLRFVTTIFTVLGLMTLAMLIGIVQEELQDRLEDIRSRRGPVYERSHFIFVGWNKRGAMILKELDIDWQAAIRESSVQDKSELKVVILLSETVSPEQRDEIAEQIEDMDFNHLDVIISVGDPSDRERLESLHCYEARSIIMLADDIPDDLKEDINDFQISSDARIIRCCYALASIFRDRGHAMKLRTATAKARQLTSAKKAGAEEVWVDLANINVTVELFLYTSARLFEDGPLWLLGCRILSPSTLSNHIMVASAQSPRTIKILTALLSKDEEKGCSFHYVSWQEIRALLQKLRIKTADMTFRVLQLHLPSVVLVGLSRRWYGRRCSINCTCRCEGLSPQNHVSHRYSEFSLSSHISTWTVMGCACCAGDPGAREVILDFANNLNPDPDTRLESEDRVLFIAERLGDWRKVIESTQAVDQIISHEFKAVHHTISSVHNLRASQKLSGITVDVPAELVFVGRLEDNLLRYLLRSVNAMATDYVNVSFLSRDEPRIIEEIKADANKQFSLLRLRWEAADTLNINSITAGMRKLGYNNFMEHKDLQMAAEAQEVLSPIDALVVVPENSVAGNNSTKDALGIMMTMQLALRQRKVQQRNGAIRRAESGVGAGGAGGGKTYHPTSTNPSKPAHIITTVRDSDRWRVANQFPDGDSQWAPDFLPTNNMVAQIIAEVATNEELCSVWGQLLTNYGPEIYMRRPSVYFEHLTGEARQQRLTFVQTTEFLRSGYGDLLLGWYDDSTEETHLNPPRDGVPLFNVSNVNPEGHLVRLIVLSQDSEVS
eukprot:Clim_evm10s49 gene=Clim_evmTU10s49